MAWLNYTLRFALELCGIAALAVFGWSVSESTLVRVAAAVAACSGLIVVWALVVAPRARNGISQTARMLVGTVLLAGCAVCLAVAGHGGLAAIFLVVNLANTIALLVLGGPGDTLHADRASDPSRRA